jgi:glycosyltransferase involved in cell wall biosynthesis
VSVGAEGLNLVASVIARDELARYQPALVHHLSGWVDEVRVLDDCSTDGTYQALEALGPKVHVQHILGASAWDMFGEGAARQQALEWAMQARPTHVLHVDADEVIPDGKLLRRAILRNPDCDVFTLTMREIWKRDGIPWQERVDGQWGPRECPILWRVPDSARRTGELPDGYNIRPVKLASGREPEIVATLGAFGDAVRTGVDILHLGWSDPAERRPRYDRYMQIDGGEHHASEHLLSIIEPPELEPYPAHHGVLGSSTS